MSHNWINDSKLDACFVQIKIIEVEISSIKTNAFSTISIINQLVSFLLDWRVEKLNNFRAHQFQILLNTQ